MAVEKTALDTKTRQKRKFEKLRSRHLNRSLDPKYVAVNISGRTVSR